MYYFLLLLLILILVYSFVRGHLVLLTLLHIPVYNAIKALVWAT